MKVHVIGGGPAGLYFAILMKKAWPATRITVFERNRPDDTFGFGVVFSDQTLDTFESLRPRELSRHHRPLRLLGRHRDPFPRHDAPHRRQRLLRLLARDAAEDPRPARALARRRDQVPDAKSRRSTPRSAMPISWWWPTASIRACARPSPTSSSRTSTCGRTSSPGWARRGRSMPSPSSSARPSTASSSPTATSTSRGARPGSSRPIRETFARAGLDKLDEAASARFVESAVRRRAAGPPAHHQPLDLAQFPDHPLRTLGRRQHGADRRRQGDGAFLHRLRHQAGDGGRDRALRGVPCRPASRDVRRRRSRAFRDRSGARRWRRRSTRPTSRWSGSSTSTASGTWTRRASPSA